MRASREMSLETDPVAALGILVSALREDLGIRRAGVFLYEHHAHLLDRIFGIDPEGKPEQGIERLPVTPNTTPLMDVARRVRPCFFSDNAPADYPDFQFQPGLKALAVIPIIVGEEFLGVLCADNRPGDEPFQPGVKDLLFLYAGLAALPLFALYQRRETERTDAMRRHIHREVLYAVTSGKMQLCEPDEIAGEWPLLERPIPIHEELDVRVVREAIRKRGLDAGMSDERSADMGLCASEAATNALLHGSGGEAYIEIRDNRLRIRVEDHGGGIHPDDLPRATLLKGWSKRASMGLGFTVIKETADLVLLCTGDQGTTIIIEMTVSPSLADIDSYDALLWGEPLGR